MFSGTRTSLAAQGLLRGVIYVGTMPGLSLSGPSTVISQKVI